MTHNNQIESDAEIARKIQEEFDNENDDSQEDYIISPPINPTNRNNGFFGIPNMFPNNQNNGYPPNNFGGNHFGHNFISLGPFFGPFGNNLQNRPPRQGDYYNGDMTNLAADLLAKEEKEEKKEKKEEKKEVKINSNNQFKLFTHNVICSSCQEPIEKGKAVTICGIDNTTDSAFIPAPEFENTYYHKECMLSIFSPDKKQSECCPICLNSLKPDEGYYICTSNHIIHVKCFEQTTKEINKTTCLMCNSKYQEK